MKGSSSAALRRVLKYIQRRWPLLALSILLAAASVAGTLYVPILIGDAIDCIVGPGEVDFLTIAALLGRIAAVAAATAIMQWIMSDLNNRITFGVVRDVRRDAFDKLQILPLSYLDAHPSGELVSRIIADADQFADGLLMGFTQLFTGVVTILGTLFFMLRIHWMIALVVVVLTPLSLFAAKFIAGKTYSMFQLQSSTRGEQTAHMDEMIVNQKVVQAFSHEQQSLEKFDEINGRLEHAALRATFFSSLTNPVTRFVNSIVYAAVGLTGALAAVSGNITVGNLSTLLSYANQYTKPFNEISGVVTELQNALACAARLFAVIDEPAQIPDAPDAAVLSDVLGSVALEHVAFSYVPEKKLIEDLNLRVQPGQRIAIVGPTGCGKTTLINLLMRFYDVDAGEISVEGRDIRQVTRRSLRASYGMVLQDTWLMSGTADMGNILTLAAAAVLALCWHKDQVSNKTLASISVLLGIFVGLLMGAIHIGYFFAVNEGFLLLFEDGGLAAVGLNTGIGIIDVVRRFLMHLFFNSTYGMIFNISLAGIIDVIISAAFYFFFMRFMIKRARS